MKKKFKLFKAAIPAFFLIFTASCSLISPADAGKGSGSVTFSLDDNVARAIASKTADDYSQAERILTVSLSGSYSDSRTKAYASDDWNKILKDKKTDTFTFEEIPEGARIRLKAEVFAPGSDDPYFSGESDEFTVKIGSNSVSLALAKLLNTSYALYNYSDSAYSYYLVDSLSAGISSETPFDGASQNSFCFDNDGYFYCVDGTTVHSDNPKFTDDGVSLDSTGTVTGITVDHATNILYAWYCMQATFYIYKLPTVISQGNSEDMVTISPTFDITVFGSENNGGNCYHDEELLVINNGKAYGFVSGGNPTLTNGKFYELDLTEETPEAKLIDINEAIIDKLPEDSESAKITDMLYQDGAVYMLLKNMDTTISFFSRGALLRYNTLTSSVDTLGFSNQVDKSSLANTKISAYTYIYDDDAYKPLYNDEALTIPWFVNADKDFTDSDSGEQKNLYNEFPGIFTPAIASSISTKQFYGPSKFVAVKPKKLVIADDGLAFYTDNDVLKYKNVNRIVTVDLNSFSIVGTEAVSANFGGESSDEIVLLNVSSSTSYQEALEDEVSTDSQKYYENDDGAKLTRASGVYLVAPCGD